MSLFMFKSHIVCLYKQHIKAFSHFYKLGYFFKLSILFAVEKLVFCHMHFKYFYFVRHLCFDNKSKKKNLNSEIYNPFLRKIVPISRLENSCLESKINFLKFHVFF